MADKWRVRVYIASAGADLSDAAQIAAHLNAAKIQTAINGKLAAIRQADAVLVLVSPTSAESGHLRDVVRRAQDTGTRIIPALVAGDHVPALLAALDVEDVRDGDFAALPPRLRDVPPLPPFVVPPIPDKLTAFALFMAGLSALLLFAQLVMA